ncbi:NAD-dependent dehydratase [Sagittula sp. P11]|jgi:nucleoside-diphosphate-sugar epimerase|uniref:D-erythronate dehydrogenase n=1 Tax=unclassified Sagittula TaxID=2624628 RepID=UPI000C2D34C3|nr:MULTISPECIES: D-erythronate dehydrogenase [unclassified Sagittula]AUC52092.1 NAD-dependent dehydratase [Sagittula sp. P11]WHZ36708.1 SDR family oxidoreductase [Sagittula sp. MA-2]
MNILIIGGAGVVARKLARALADKGTLRGKDISKLTLADIGEAETVDAPFPVETAQCDITDPASVAKIITEETDVIYLLAAVVSAHAEEDFDFGYKVNMFGTLNVLERCRALGTKPVLVFTSSIAVFGGEVPQPFHDHSALNPQISYGAQKAIGELLVNDYTRRGFIDGRGFRLPTISVRPGKANRAASSFMSSIFREPLQGQEAVCPVDEAFPHFYLSPKQCALNLVTGAEIPAEDLGLCPTMTMPGRVWTIRQMIDAMTAVAGPEPAKLIRWEEQPEIAHILKGWRLDVRPQKAERLGLKADDSFEDNIRYFLEEDIVR